MTETQIVVDYVLPDRRHSQGVMKAPMPSYTLALLLAQTPETLNGCRVVGRVHDEQASGRYEPGLAQPDILCLTYLTTGALRAYEISDAAAKATSHSGRAIKVVHGGVHATSLPREALLHSHVAVRGEITPDFQRRLLEHALTLDPSERSIVRLPNPPSVITRPPADWSWMDRKKYIVAPVTQSSVGCPFHCDFCSVTEVFGAAMRNVSEECLRAELARIPGHQVMAIIDDNFLQGVQPRYIEHCLSVARVFKEMRRPWVTEVTVKTLVEARRRMAEERKGFDLIRYFAENGCLGFFFGIETIADDGAGLKKRNKVDDTVQMIRACQSEGIGVLGAFVLGLSPDETPDYAKRLLEFAIDRARLDFAQFSINTPMPGARNFLTGIRDNQILSFDWELYDAEHAVLRHPTMSPEQLEASHRWLYKEFYGYRSIFKRADLLPLVRVNPRLWRRAAVGFPANMILHRTNRSWNNRLDHAIPRAPVPQPHPTVMDHVREALGSNPARPNDLFDIARPDGVSVTLDEILASRNGLNGACVQSAEPRTRDVAHNV